LYGIGKAERRARPFSDTTTTLVRRYGAAPLGNTPGDFRSMIAADTNLQAEAVKFSGIKLQ
jgi:hypothetical protein